MVDDSAAHLGTDSGEGPTGLHAMDRDDRLEWPVIRAYDSDHLDRISLPLGGIGTGTIGLGGRGDLRDFEVGNRPAKGFRPENCLAALRVQSGSEPAEVRLLEGPLPDSAFEGWKGATGANHGAPRFAQASFEAAYPLGRVQLDDPAVPVSVRIEGFNPLIPGDLEASSWPVAVLRYRLINNSQQQQSASVALAISNFVGSNGTEDQTGGNENTPVNAGKLAGIRMLAPDLDADAEAAGEFVLAVLNADGGEVSSRTAWNDDSWGGSLLDFWDDLSADGMLDDRESSSERPVASLCQLVDLPPASEREITFVLAWRFPNRRAWRSEEDHDIATGRYDDEIVGNFYAETHDTAWAAAQEFVEKLDDYERRTKQAVSALAASSVPSEITEAALFNLSTLRSPTVFRTADGRFFGWEGVTDRSGSCFGSCSHVWGYEFATASWFPEISRSMRETQFGLCTDERGLMSFRVGLPVSKARDWRLAAADGQMAALVHLYHDWRLSGDTSWLESLWAQAKSAMEFCWIDGGWDADMDGVMEGCQHNTMDVEYYGPNPQMGTWYIAALLACAAMAEALHDQDFAQRCRRLAANGSRWLDDNLFNGTYYRHQVQPPLDAHIAEGLRHPSMGSARLDDPDLQLADGCLIDQLVGQYAARTVGLDHVLDPHNISATLASIGRRNFRPDLASHFNNMRTYATAEEAATLMCTYDEGNRPARPFPYFSEVMTGFEYTAATSMIFDGDRIQGLELISAIRSRYRGNRRNPFDEAECGFHYARAMASWSAFIAWTGFSWDANAGVIAVDLGRDTASTFWTAGSAWGTWSQTVQDGQLTGQLTIMEGRLPVRALDIGGTTIPIDHPEQTVTIPS